VILTNASGAGLTATQSEAAVRWRGLARRGMLYSECEAIDYLELAPHAVLTMRGRSGAEEVWYVLAGHVEFDGQEGGPLRAGCGDLVLRPASISANEAGREEMKAGKMGCQSEKRRIELE